MVGRKRPGGAAPGAPWLAPFERWFLATDPRPQERLELDALNAFAAARGLRLEDGRPLRFVGTPAGSPDRIPYELEIAQSGSVPTRVAGPGMLHDWFNALCWLRWPATKARLNRLQAEAIRGGATGSVRGRLRDAITLFDESGAVLVSRDAARTEAWQRFDWQRLFVVDRADFAGDVRVLIVGHALLEKLLAPYKSICAHALPLAWPPEPGAAIAAGSPEARASSASAAPRSTKARGVELPGIDEIDRLLAASLDAGSLARERFLPLPLLGIPGWAPANEDPAFYNDPQVFRQRRQRRRE